MDRYDPDYRSGNFPSYGGFGGGGGGGGGGRGLEIVPAGGSRVHNAGYAGTAPPQPPRSSSSSSTSWWDDPDMKRKRRVAAYKAYSVEGRVKASIRKSFRWIKTKCSELVHGW